MPWGAAFQLLRLAGPQAQRAAAAAAVGDAERAGALAGDAQAVAGGAGEQRGDRKSVV